MYLGLSNGWHFGFLVVRPPRRRSARVSPLHLESDHAFTPPPYPTRYPTRYSFLQQLTHTSFLLMIEDSSTYSPPPNRVATAHAETT